VGECQIAGKGINATLNTQRSTLNFQGNAKKAWNSPFFYFDVER
jgi:hypothetical protein